jgi:plastocyanin domain-containing protein
MKGTLALGLVLLGMASGCDKKSDDSQPSAPASGARAVPITVDGKGFAPASVNLKKSEKVQLVFTRTSDDTCATEVVFPEINVKKALPLNKAVAIDVPTDAARTLTFQCGMGMFKSKVVIN